MTFGWVRPQFRFLSLFSSVGPLSLDILWANPFSLDSAVERSVCPFFPGSGRVNRNLLKKDSYLLMIAKRNIFFNFPYCASKSEAIFQRVASFTSEKLFRREEGVKK